MTEKWKHFKRIVFPGEVNPVRNPSPAIAGLETERGIRSRPTGRNPELFKNVIPLQPPARREQQGIISNGVNFGFIQSHIGYLYRINLRIMGLAKKDKGIVGGVFIKLQHRKPLKRLSTLNP